MNCKHGVTISNSRTGCRGSSSLCSSSLFPCRCLRVLQSVFQLLEERNVPYAKPNFPFGNFGDILLFRATFGLVFENIYKELDVEKYGGTYALTKPGFIFRDPDIIKMFSLRISPVFMTVVSSWTKNVNN